jgi:hypothetical protein
MNGRRIADQPQPRRRVRRRGEEPVARGPRRGAMQRAILFIAAAGWLLVACTGPATPPASGSPGVTEPPSAPAPASVAPSLPTTSITNLEEAFAAVIPADPRFAGIPPVDPDRIGGCCFWTARRTATGYAVTIEIGWGDCQAGCIDRHHWFFSVTPDGAVTLDREDGPPVPAGVPGPGGGPGVPGIHGVATAGPVCPVVRPDDPACADRPVAGATIHVIDATGTEVALLETDASGGFTVALPAGRYQLRADPVEGLMGAPAPVDVTVEAAMVTVALPFDTGIR